MGLRMFTILENSDTNNDLQWKFWNWNITEEPKRKAGAREAGVGRGPGEA